MEKRMKIFARIAAAALIALLAACVDGWIRQQMEIPIPSPRKIEQLNACAAELAEMEFSIAYPDWEKGILSIEKYTIQTTEMYEELCDIDRIFRHGNGIFFIRDSNIFLGARGYLVCDISDPEFSENEHVEWFEGNVFGFAEGWD